MRKSCLPTGSHRAKRVEIIVAGAMLLLAMLSLSEGACAHPAADGDDLTFVNALAESLMVAGNDEDAATEFLRYAFFCPDSARSAVAHEQVAACHQRLGNHSAALEAEWAALQLRQGSEERDVLKAAQAQWFAKAGNPGRAQIEWLTLAQRSRDSSRQAAAWLEISRLHIASNQWSAARTALERHGALSGQSEASDWLARADSLLADQERRPVRSEQTARWLSTLLPGLGQVYSGRYGSAVNALVINAVMGTLLVKAAIAGDVSDLLLVGPFFERYYSGNRYWAGEFAKQASVAEDRRAREIILSILPDARAVLPVDGYSRFSGGGTGPCMVLRF